MSNDKKLPAVLHIVGKPLLERLKEWLWEHRLNYTHIRTGEGGCDTCGYGAPEIEEINMDELNREIDAFGESLKDEKRL